MKTQDLTQATISSRTRSIINSTISNTKFIRGRGACNPNKVGSRWLATKLAARRAAKVTGWITLLTVSIITIISIKNPGVPTGT